MRLMIPKLSYVSGKTLNQKNRTDNASSKQNIDMSLPVNSSSQIGSKRETQAILCTGHVGLSYLGPKLENYVDVIIALSVMLKMVTNRERIGTRSHRGFADDCAESTSI